MSKPKVWTLPELLDRIWTLSRGKRTAVAVAEKGVTIEIPRLLLGSDKIEIPPGVTIKRVVTGWDEDYKPRTYELNKISAASAAALYERIKHMRAEKPRLATDKALVAVVDRLTVDHLDRCTSDEFWATVRDWTDLGDFASIQLCQKAKRDPHTGECDED